MGLHESALVVSVLVTVSRNVGAQRITIMDAAVQDWLCLVSAVDEHYRRLPHIVASREPLLDLIFAFSSIEIDESKFDVSSPQAVVGLSLIPVWSELRAGWAIGIDEAYDPNVLIISHDLLLECVEVEALRSGPNSVVDSVARWVLGPIVRKLSLGSLHGTLFAKSFTVAEILDEDTESVCIWHSVVLKRPALVAAVEKNGRRVH